MVGQQIVALPAHEARRQIVHIVGERSIHSTGLGHRLSSQWMHCLTILDQVTQLGNVAV